MFVFFALVIGLRSVRGVLSSFSLTQQIADPNEHVLVQKKVIAQLTGRHRDQVNRSSEEVDGVLGVGE